MNRELIIPIAALLIGIILTAMFPYLFIIPILSFLYAVYVNQKKSKDSLKTAKTTEEIYAYVTNEREKYQRREKLVSLLVNSGVIDQNRLLEMLKQKEIIIAIPYGEGVPQSLKKSYNGNLQPIQTILQKLGFIKPFEKYYVWTQFPDELPEPLRSPEKIEEFIKNELHSYHGKIGAFAISTYPKSRYPKKYEKWRTGEGLGGSYIILKAPINKIKMGFVKTSDFNLSFIALLSKYITKDATKTVEKQKIKKIIGKTALDLLLPDIEKRVVEKIDEAKLIKELKLDNFTEYRLCNSDALKRLINTMVGEEHSEKISNQLMENSKEYYDMLKDMGIILSD